VAPYFKLSAITGFFPKTAKCSYPNSNSIDKFCMCISIMRI
jgi:hypothetical protein